MRRARRCACRNVRVTTAAWSLTQSIFCRAVSFLVRLILAFPFWRFGTESQRNFERVSPDRQDLQPHLRSSLLAQHHAVLCERPRSCCAINPFSSRSSVDDRKIVQIRPAGPDCSVSGLAGARGCQPINSRKCEKPLLRAVKEQLSKFGDVSET